MLNEKLVFFIFWKVWVFYGVFKFNMFKMKELFFFVKWFFFWLLVFDGSNIIYLC